MAFKFAVDDVRRFDLQPLSWRKYLVLFALGICYVAIFFYPLVGSKYFLSADLPALVICGVVFVGAFWYGSRNSKKSYLVFTDTDLKQVGMKIDFSFPWREIQLVQINKDRQGRVNSFSILMQAGKLWNISGYSDMDSAAKLVTKYAKTGQIDGLLNSIRTKPWIGLFAGNILTILVLLGWRLFPKQVPFELVFIPLVGLMMWLHPTKAGSDFNKRVLKHYLFVFLLLFGLIVIIAVMLRVFAR